MGRRAGKPRVAAGLAALVAAAALVASADAGAEGPAEVRVENLDLFFDGGVRPMRISRTRPTPIAFDVSTQIKTVDGTKPPALSEFVLETDRAGLINVTGLPVCPPGRLQSKQVKAAEAACRGAIVGRGETSAEVSFPEGKRIPLRSRLLVLNGGRRGGLTTLYIQGYFGSPVAAGFVVPVKISRLPRGPYGLRSVAEVPKIAGGAGSVTSFSVEIDRKYSHRGHPRSVVTATCDGVLGARGLAVFADGMRVEGNVFRPCTPVG
jgi:hypothetical protein